MESSTCEKESFNTNKVFKRENWPKEEAANNSWNGWFTDSNTLENVRWEFPVDNLVDATASGFSTAIVFLNFV